MDSVEAWRSLFENWPEQIDREGMVISKQGEVVVFEDFLVSAGMVLLQRNAPDASGARKAFLAFHEIAMVKLPSTKPLDEFQQMGFRPPRVTPARRVGDREPRALGDRESRIAQRASRPTDRRRT